MAFGAGLVFLGDAVLVVFGGVVFSWSRCVVFIFFVVVSVAAALPLVSS